jgi:tRNA pseudouridine38-40 synthase
MPTYRIDLEYHGAAYRGWQSQKNAVGVANVVEKAVFSVFKDAKGLVGAGRTDAGVHALHQVAHFRASELKQPRKNPLLSLNDALPPNVAVLGVGPVPDSFNARTSATGRVYLYQIMRRRSAFGADQAWWVKDRLDMKAMAQARDFLLGRHDFAAFSDLDPEKPKETTLDLGSIELVEHGPLLLLRFRARSFLWKMVRRVTGYLVEVGRGRYKASGTEAMFKEDRKTLAPYTAPPQGLYLERVLYPGDHFNDALKPVLNLMQ